MDAHSAGEALSQIRQSAEESSKVAAEMAISVHRQRSRRAHTHIIESIRDVTNMINEISNTAGTGKKFFATFRSSRKYAGTLIIGLSCH